MHQVFKCGILQKIKTIPNIQSSNIKCLALFTISVPLPFHVHKSQFMHTLRSLKNQHSRKT